jgi:hypothetical protein
MNTNSNNTNKNSNAVSLMVVVAMDSHAVMGLVSRLNLLMNLLDHFVLSSPYHGVDTPLATPKHYTTYYTTEKKKLRYQQSNFFIFFTFSITLLSINFPLGRENKIMIK